MATLRFVSNQPQWHVKSTILSRLAQLYICTEYLIFVYVVVRYFNQLFSYSKIADVSHQVTRKWHSKCRQNAAKPDNKNKQEFCEREREGETETKFVFLPGDKAPSKILWSVFLYFYWGLKLPLGFAYKIYISNNSNTAVDDVPTV